MYGKFSTTTFQQQHQQKQQYKWQQQQEKTNIQTDTAIETRLDSTKHESYAYDAAIITIIRSNLSGFHSLLKKLAQMEIEIEIERNTSPSHIEIDSEDDIWFFSLASVGHFS